MNHPDQIDHQANDDGRYTIIILVFICIGYWQLIIVPSCILQTRPIVSVINKINLCTAPTPSQTQQLHQLVRHYSPWLANFTTMDALCKRYQAQNLEDIATNSLPLIE